MVNGRTTLDIYIKVVGTDRSMRLTFDAAKDFRPAWSPEMPLASANSADNRLTFRLIAPETSVSPAI